MTRTPPPRSAFLSPYAAPLVGLVALSACIDRGRPSDKVAPASCSGASVGLEAIAGGAVLCDHQHLVASLDPNRHDARAGLGAIEIPFRVTEVAERDYCFTDDDSEGHTLALVDGDGNVALDLRAGGRCTTAKLAAGDYSLRLVHSRPGETDANPDVIHSKLESRSSRSVLTFQSNTCRGCSLTGAWPCVDQGDSRYCGFVGDYAGAQIFAGTCIAGLEGDCVLGGSFDGAHLASNRIVAKRLVLGNPDGATPGPSSFRGIDFNAYDGYYPETLVLRGVSALTGDLDPFFPKYVVNESPQIEVSWFIGLDAMRKASTFTGPALRAQTGKTTDFSGLTLDLGRMVPYPPLVDGRRSYSGFRFAKANLSGLRSFRDGTERIEMRNVDFSGARLTDCDVDVDSLEGSTFEGATLTRARLGAHLLPSHENVVGSDLSFARATLDDVTFGTDPNETSSSSPQVFDASRLDATDAVVRRLVARRTKLDDSTWRGAIVAPESPAGFSFVASESSFDGASFRDLTSFQRVVWQDCSLGKSAVAPSRAFALSLLGAVASVSEWNLDGSEVLGDGIAPSTFERCSFVGATLSGSFGLRAFEGCSFRSARFASGSSLVRSTFRGCDFSEADIRADMSSVTATSTPFVRASFGGPTSMGGAIFTEGPFDGARFCDGATPAGATFDRVSLRGAVVPAAEEPPYQESATELACQGTIPLAQRRVLGTDRATACPDGLAGPCGGAGNDTRWTPVRGQSRPVCCTPSPSAPTCVRHVKGAPCTSACDCSSLACVAGKCG